MKIAILQLNFIVGDIEGNARKIILGYREALKRGAELVVTSELAILGYPPKDLLLQEDFIFKHHQALKKIIKKVGKVGLVIGVIEDNKKSGKRLFNSAVLIQNGKVAHTRRKELLPTYDVFDELRYFEVGVNTSPAFRYNGELIALRICEDIWGATGGTEDPNGPRLYSRDPLRDLENLSEEATLIVVNGSPYYLGKGDVRQKHVSGLARRLGHAVVYANQVGGNDDLVFDGRSFVVSKKGGLVGIARAFEEDILIVDTKSKGVVKNYKDTGDAASLRHALVMGTRDYIKKTGHKSVVIGLSGGIDSAVTAAVAVAAIGAENVTGFTMPSRFSSVGSVTDSEKLAKNLGIKLNTIPIGGIYNSFGRELKGVIDWDGGFSSASSDVTEENVQARARGVLLMAHSNKTGSLVLSTGNKSELAVGYCTLYGDMVGGMAVLSDVPKTDVYRLARYINKDEEIIPKATIDKPPSAELRPGQEDSDSLPPYETLDAILHLLVEERMGSDEIVSLGYPPEVVGRVAGMVTRNEYKRIQMPVGIRVTTKAFGSGRRFPIAAKFKI